MDPGADNQRRRDSAQLLGTQPSVAVDASAPASEPAYSRAPPTPPITEHRGSLSENRGVSSAQVDDKSGSWKHPHHHHHQLHYRTGHLAGYADQLPVSQEMERRYPATERPHLAVDIPDPARARNIRAAGQRRDAGQDQGMFASHTQIRPSPDACPPSILAHPVNHYAESYRSQSITSHARSIHPPHKIVQDERPFPFERQPPPQRAEHQPHSLFIHTAQHAQEQDYHHHDRRSPQISPMDYHYRETQSPLSPQALIPPLQSLWRAPSDPAGMDGGNRTKIAGRQYSPPTPSGHSTKDQRYKLDSRGSPQRRHHPYRYSPPQPGRGHSGSASPQEHWTHSPHEHQPPYLHHQQHQPQQSTQRQPQQQHQQQQQQQQQRTQLHQEQLLPDQTSMREHLVSQIRRKELMELGRQQVEGYEGEEMRPTKYEQLTNIKATKSGTNNDRRQPRLQPFNTHPLGATSSPASPKQTYEETPSQSRPSVRMTPALSFSNISSNPATSRVDQRTLTPHHQYRAQRPSHQHQQDKPPTESVATFSRPPPSPQGGAPTPMSPPDYDRQGPNSETRAFATPQSGDRRVAFMGNTSEETTRPHVITRGSSLEARWEPTPRTLGSGASNQELYDGDEFSDPAIPRRHSAADALELRSQDRRGDVRLRQGRFQDARSNSLVVAPGEVFSAHYVTASVRTEQQECSSRNLRDAHEHFGRQHPQRTMFVEVNHRDTNPGSSSRASGHLSSVHASPTEGSSRKDISPVAIRLAENGHGALKQESMEIEMPPGSVAVAAAAAGIITGIGTNNCRSDYIELDSLAFPGFPGFLGELGKPGYYSERALQKLYWAWRTHQEEEEKRSSQQSQQSDRDDVSMRGADEGDTHDGGGTNDGWPGSQHEDRHEDRHVRDGPELRPSSQEGKDGGGTPNKGKSRKVEKASRYEDEVARRRSGSKAHEIEEWDSEKEEEDEDDVEEDGEGDDDGEEGDDGYCESEDGDDGDGFDDGSAGKPGAEDREDGKNAVARRTRTQTGRRGQPRGHSENSSGAPSRASTSASGEGVRRSRAKDDKKHGCDECQKRFSRPSQLKTHQLTHSGEKPHQCHLCDKYFNVASNLKRHIRTHDKIPRKNSRDGSGVFRGFTQGFQAKHNPNLKASSPDVNRKARSAKTNLGSNAVISRRPAGTTHPPERLRWMSTETPESSMMAASRQAKNAAIKQRTAEGGASSSSSRPGSTTSPSEASTPVNAQPAVAVGVEAATSVAHPSPLTGSSAVRDQPPQPLPPPTPQPSRESDSESTLVDGTQASDEDEDMGNNERGLNDTDISHNG